MGLSKSIESGKERRKKYRKSKAFDRSCRNHGGCDYCKGNRQLKNKKRELSANEQIENFKEKQNDDGF